MKYFAYLAGGMGKFGRALFDEGNKWRVYCKQALENCECDFKVKVCNPQEFFNFLDEPRYESHAEVMRLDLHKLRNSGIVIVNFNDKWSLGTQAEIAIAYDRGIPVIGLNESGQELHPWQEEFCERIFSDIDEMLDYIEDFYLR